MKLGIFADRPVTACTGFSIVCSNLALELAKLGVSVYYFGRFGQKSGFAKFPDPTWTFPYFYIPCEGGVWKAKTVIEAIKHYKIDAIFSEDDWFSMDGLLEAAHVTKKPFFFLTPIDSLPIPKETIKKLRLCTAVFTPNSSYKILRQYKVNAFYLPHGVRTEFFKPLKKPETFTFIWIGRDEPRKALGRFIIACSEILMKTDANILIHSDWETPSGKRTKKFLHKEFYAFGDRIFLSQMSNMRHKLMTYIYNRGHVFVCTAKAGGFEMGITESASCEVPSIVNNWTFMRENVVHGKTGWLVDWSSLERDWMGHRRVWANINIRELAKRMLWCYNNQEEVRRVGRQARQYVKEKYDWLKIAKHLLGTITKYVSG